MDKDLVDTNEMCNLSEFTNHSLILYKSHAVGMKPHDAACFCLRPMTLWLLFASAYER